MKERESKLRIKSMLCCLAMLSGLMTTACASQGGNAGASEKKIYVIGQTEGMQFWDNVKLGAEQAAEEFQYDMHFSCSKSVSDIEGQIKLMEEAISSHADAIVIAPNNSDALADTVKKAKDAGIAVVAIDADFSDMSMRSSYVGTNNLTSGKIAGRHAIEAFEDIQNDKVLIVTHSETAASAQQRVGGFQSVVGPYYGSQMQAIAMAAREEAMKQATAQAQAGGNNENGENAGGPPEGIGGPPDGAGGPPDGAGGPPDGAGGPPEGVGGAPEGAGGPPEGAQGSPIAAVLNCGGDVNIAKAQTMEQLKQNPDIKIVFATNETSTLGVCQAIQEMEYDPDELTVIGFNSNEAEIQYLRNGVLDALIIQHPYNMGYLGVHYAGQVSNGSSVSALEDTGSMYVTMDNLESEDVQLFLDPAGFTN